MRFRVYYGPINPGSHRYRSFVVSEFSYFKVVNAGPRPFWQRALKEGDLLQITKSGPRWVMKNVTTNNYLTAFWEQWQSPILRADMDTVVLKKVKNHLTLADVL